MSIARQALLSDIKAESIAIGNVLGSTCTSMKQCPLPIILGTIGLATMHCAFAALVDETDMTLPSLVAYSSVVYLTICCLLQRRGLNDRKGGIVAYVIVSLLLWLGVCCGLLLFIVPALYLLSRWSLAPVLVLARGSSATKALSESWRATQRCAWKLLFLYVGCVTIWMLVVFANASIALLTETYGIIRSAESSPAFIISLATAVAFGVAASAYLKVAVYEWLIERSRQLEAVFA